MPTPTNLPKLTDLQNLLSRLTEVRKLMETEETNILTQLDRAKARHDDYSSVSRTVLTQAFTRLYTHSASYGALCVELFEKGSELT